MSSSPIRFATRLSKCLESFLDRRGVLCVGAFALFYYGLYFNADLTLNGEAGSNVLIAQRINEGWRPIKDMFIGYNLLWFYPLAWIFEFTGPHLLASRIYFMALAGVSGLLGFLLVRRATGIAILAAIAGALMILMPGAMYRNTVGFVGTLASFALVYGYVVPHRSRVSRILWMGFAGAAMSLCFLIRIEPALIVGLVWAGLVFLYPFGVRGEFLSRLRTVGAGTLVSIAAFATIHAPFVYHAHLQGYGPEFTKQYSQFVGLLRWELERQIRKLQPALHIAKPIAGEASPAVNTLALTPAGNSTNQPVKCSTVNSADGRRPRPPLFDAIQKGQISFFPVSIYFPVLSAVILAVFGCAALLAGAFRGDEADRRAGLAILTTTGCALALFPQYFFFRPDSVHLAEFMVPFYPALACAVAVAIGEIRARNFRAWTAGLVLTVACLQVVVACNSLFGREGSGSIRIAKGKTALFEAPGGIRFRVRPSELADWERLRDTLEAATCDGGYLVTFPYVPILNVMARSPSYQFKLYVDNATESPDFAEKAIAELKEKQPVAVVVNNRKINSTEISRFNNWAAPVHAHLMENYTLAGTYFSNIEVYVRPDRWPESAR